MDDLVHTGEFINLLWNTFKESSPEPSLISYGRTKGWLEDEDQRFSDRSINRRTAARIIHQFMKTELKVPDSIDIRLAEELKDLYTCRVCANHIAQVYVRGIMMAQEIEHEGKIVKIFNHLESLERDQILEIFDKLKETVVTNFQREKK